MLIFTLEKGLIQKFVCFFGVKELHDIITKAQEKTPTGRLSIVLVSVKCPSKVNEERTNKTRSNIFKLEVS